MRLINGALTGFLFFYLHIATAQVDHWEALVLNENLWKYAIGSASISSDWRESSFNDDGWSSGIGGIGYGDNDDNTFIDNVESLYMRRSFIIVDKNAIDELILFADYDDAFVAYINGVEIARDNIDGNPPSHSEAANSLREAQIYQGGSPISFKVANVSDLIKEGTNTLAIQTHNFDGLSSSDLSAIYWLMVGISDTSSNYFPTPSWFVNSSFSSQLPIVKINTFGNAIPDEPSIPAEMGIIWNGEGNENDSDGEPNEFFGNISIDKRGQSSLWLFPKVGYAIEAKDEEGEDMDVSFLNFPEEEDWVLHGPFSDKSLIRNVLAMEMARRTDQYACRTRLVELLINDQYEGVYVLMEKIKKDGERVDISNLNEDDIEGDELTGGYIIKIDKDQPDFYSEFDIQFNPGNKLHFQYVYPKASKIQPAQEAYIKSYIDSFELAMKNPLAGYGGKTYDEYIDVASFIDHFLYSELGRNVDAYRFSTYLYKDKDSKGGKLTAGPAWDFNLSYGNADYCLGDEPTGWMHDLHCDNGNPFWWTILLQQESFQEAMECRWRELRNGPYRLDRIYEFIDEKANMLNAPAVRNFERWPILNTYIWPNTQVTGSYTGEINFIKEYIAARVQWMDSQLIDGCETTQTQTQGSFEFILSPNPTNDKLNLSLNNYPYPSVRIEIYDALGKRIRRLDSKQHNLSIDVSNLSSGTYLLHIIGGASANGNSVSKIQKFVKL